MQWKWCNNFKALNRKGSIFCLSLSYSLPLLSIHSLWNPVPHLKYQDKRPSGREITKMCLRIPVVPAPEQLWVFSNQSPDMWLNDLQMLTAPATIWLYPPKKPRIKNQPKQEPTSWAQPTPRTMRDDNKMIADVLSPYTWGQFVMQWQISGIFLPF